MLGGEEGERVWLGGIERIRDRIRSGVKIWVHYYSRQGLASGYRDNFGWDRMR